MRFFNLALKELSEDIKIRIFSLPTLRRRLEIEMNIRIKRPVGLERNEVTSSVFSVGKNMGERMQWSEPFNAC